jgi:hypothetical protein
MTGRAACQAIRAQIHRSDRPRSSATALGTRVRRNASAPHAPRAIDPRPTHRAAGHPRTSAGPRGWSGPSSRICSTIVSSPPCSPALNDSRRRPMATEHPAPAVDTLRNTSTDRPRRQAARVRSPFLGVSGSFSPAKSARRCRRLSEAASTHCHQARFPRWVRQLVLSGSFAESWVRSSDSWVRSSISWVLVGSFVGSFVVKRAKKVSIHAP